MESTGLDLIAPFEVAPAMAMLAAHAVPTAEIVDLESAHHTRLLTVPGAGPVAVTIHLHSDHVTLSHAPIDSDSADGLKAQVRRWLDLDADPRVLQNALGADPVIGPLVSARPGMRVISYPDGFEAAVMSVLGQQVSVAAGRTFGGRAVTVYGTPGPGGLRTFPTPETLAAATPTELQAAIGITHFRARTLHALATACTGGLNIDSDADQSDLRRRLLAIPGIGPWTVENLAVRALGDRNGFPAGDLVLQRALGVSTAAQARAAAQTWSPYRAYALFHLWSAALGM